MAKQPMILVDRCESCGDVARFEIRGRMMRCRGCLHLAPVSARSSVIADDDSALDLQLQRSNPALYEEVGMVFELRRLAVHEDRAGVRMKRTGPSWRLAQYRLEEVSDEPDSDVLRAQLRQWDYLSLRHQRDLLARVEALVTGVLQRRRASAYLRAISPSMPDPWAPFRILMPIAGLFSLLTVAALMVGDADISPWWVAALVMGPLTVIPLASVLLHPTLVRAWFKDPFISEGRRRNLDMRVLLALLSNATDDILADVDKDIRRVGLQRDVLLDLLTQEVENSLPAANAEAPLARVRWDAA